VLGGTEPLSGGGGAFARQLVDLLEEVSLPGSLSDLPSDGRTAHVLSGGGGGGGSLAAAVSAQAASAAAGVAAFGCASHVVLVARAPVPAPAASVADVAAAAAEAEADLSAALAAARGGGGGGGGGARPLLLVIPRLDDGPATPAALAARTALALLGDAAYRAAARGGLSVVDLRVLCDGGAAEWLAGALQPAGGAKLAAKLAEWVVRRLEDAQAAAGAASITLAPQPAPRATPPKPAAPAPVAPAAPALLPAVV
jgi:hypothetical protein